MSIVEVSKSVGDLAKAVHEKATELDRLKHQYLEKLELLNRYIDGLPSEVKNSSIDEHQLIAGIKQAHECPNCHHAIDWSHTGLAVMPTGLIKVPDEVRNEAQLSSLNLNASPDHTYSAPGVRSSRGAQAGGDRRQSKKICSYCSKPGHSRARCFARLNGTTPEK